MDKNQKAVDVFAGVIAEQAGAMSVIASGVADMYKAEHEVESLGVRVADNLNAVLMSQGELTLGWYQAVSYGFGDAYKVIKVGSSEEAVRKAWSRAFKLVTEYYNVVKPTSTNSEAEKKAEQRAKQAELLAAYEDKSESELRSEAKSLYNKAGDGDKEAKKQADLIVKAIDTRVKAEAKEAKDSTKAIKAEITALLKKVNDLSVLMDIQIMLEGSVDDAEYEASEI
jgi:hypothetical protein